MRRPTQPPRRLGFTLVELMVVMVVLGVLIALLVPAIGGAIKSARAAQVTAEINNIATALAQFKSTYSDYPPSRILLHENGYYNTVDPTRVSAAFSDVRSDITVGQLNQRTVRYMAKFFPRALCFSTTGASSATVTEFNGYVYNPSNGNYSLTAGEAIYLDGSECLVWFLGGQCLASSGTSPNPTGGTYSGGSSLPAPTWGATGFGRNPANPFYISGASTITPQSSRTQPFFEFKGERLVDVDGDGFPSYNDSLATGTQGRAYAYFSAYGGNSYDPNDCNLNANDALGHNLNDGFARAFSVNFPVEVNAFNTCAAAPSSTCVSPAPNPYTSSGPVGGTSPTVWQGPQSFQIISAGSDQIFGIGGQFAGNNATNRLGFPDGPYGSVCGATAPVDDGRTPEADNLSNFVSTRLNQ
ncbi:MAG: prepilin-type N-terminal cleavage/methylation domain-containing protein [Isosphaeraceae bacterium]|nr:prepilin-type N-terminal cleavage/methylation domain-containing protein [Isosphaeraceae bacterium]